MTTTAQLGIRSGNVIVPYVSVTKLSKWIDISSYITLTDAGGALSGASIKRARAQFKMDSNLVWSMKANVSFTCTGGPRTYVISALAGIVFKAGTDVIQTGYLYVRDAGNPLANLGALIDQGTGNFLVYHASASTTKYGYSFDVELNAEPTWASLGTTAADALEGVVAADVYIAPASATSAGLLSRYEEGTWTPTVTSESGSITTYTSSGRYTKIGNTVHFWASISIADKGTGSNSIRFNLPFTPAVESPLIGWSGVTGYAYTGSVKTDASAAFRKYDWTNPLENYTYVVSGTFVV